MKKNLIISFSKSGKELGEKILKFLDADFIYSKEYDGSIKEYIEKNWCNLDFIIFISSTGIAVRMIKDAIVSKDKDPGVVVMDDCGKNAISLLSGHLGGANKMTALISEKTGANPIITTATDNRNIEAVDEFSRRCNLKIENIKDIKAISAMMLDGEKIGFYSEISEVIDYKNIVRIKSPYEYKNVNGVIVVSNKIIGEIKIPHIVLRPVNVVVGVGCRRETDGREIVEAILSELEKNALSKNSIKVIASHKIKSDEQGIRFAGEYFGCDTEFFDTETLSQYDEMFKKSEFVKKTVGVYNVSSSAAYHLSRNIISDKAVYGGITISIGVIK
jgi:cobalt-precorrin 5A hydrolase